MARTLRDVEGEALDCHKCPLCETRNSVVFGVGNADAQVMFIGEAPGKQEDLGAEPFIGAAGQYLNELLGFAGLKREEIYIANVLKCRPPGNRDPQPDEIELCTPFLRDQIRAVRPDVLVTLGNFSTRFVLKTDRGITSLRGKLYQVGRFQVLPIFHPAAALYSPDKKPLLEHDFKLLGAYLANLNGLPGTASPAEAAAMDAALSGAETSSLAPEAIGSTVTELEERAAARRASQSADSSAAESEQESIFDISDGAGTQGNA